MKSKIRQPVKISVPFKTKQAKRKAVNSVKKSLPSTQRKTAEVVKEIFPALTPSSQRRIKNPKNNLSSNVRIPVSFCEDDSISRVMPGKKDVLSVQCNDNEKKEQNEKGFFWIT